MKKVLLPVPALLLAAAGANAAERWTPGKAKPAIDTLPPP